MAGGSTPGPAQEAARLRPQTHTGVRAWPYVLALVGLINLLAIVLLAMGRVPWCTCGYIKLWHGVVQSSENSQHLTDWYTFAHVLDGFGFYLALWLVGRDWPLLLRLTLATTFAAAWEVFENTDFVIDHYRAATFALGYRGDSIVNSVGDVLACVLGFALAALLPIRASVALVAALGLLAGWVIGYDRSTLPTLIAPMEASIENWLGP